MFLLSGGVVVVDALKVTTEALVDDVLLVYFSQLSELLT